MLSIGITACFLIAAIFQSEDRNDFLLWIDDRVSGNAHRRILTAFVNLVLLVIGLVQTDHL